MLLAKTLLILNAERMSWFTKIFGHKQKNPFLPAKLPELHEKKLSAPILIKIKGSSGKETSFEFCPIPGQDYYLGKYPVTQQQWEAVMGNNPSDFKGGSLPVETVSWDDAQLFIKKLNQLSGKKNYRLPTEEEWEYACWAGTTSEYYFGDDESQLGEYAWYEGNAGRTTHPVGQKKPNEWGLYDMAGNVWEWTDSWYDSSRSYRVARGGSWYCFVEFCRSAMVSSKINLNNY